MGGRLSPGLVGSAVGSTVGIDVGGEVAVASSRRLPNTQHQQIPVLPGLRINAPRPQPNGLIHQRASKVQRSADRAVQLDEIQRLPGQRDVIIQLQHDGMPLRQTRLSIS